jgi:pyruvate formate lyase activating enzyme
VNPELFEPIIPLEKIFEFLRKRIGLIDGVEFTGGEPTLQYDLKEISRVVKSLGFLVKLDTNGSNPNLTKELIADGLIDYIAMDIKAPINDYENAIGVKWDKEKIVQSIEIIKNSHINYEFRTTMIRGIIQGKEAVEQIGKLIKGAKLYFMQTPHFEKILSKDFKGDFFTEAELIQFKKILEGYVDFVGIR